jgi:hypothetical protein
LGKRIDAKTAEATQLVPTAPAAEATLSSNLKKTGFNHESTKMLTQISWLQRVF